MLRRFRFNLPQRIAAGLLALFLLQGFWLTSRQTLTDNDYQYARCGRETWERPSPLAGYYTSCGNIHDGILAYRLAGLPLTLNLLAQRGMDLFRKPETQSAAGCLLWAALVGCLAALYPMRTQDWAPVAAGALFGAYFWAYAKSAGRSYPLLTIGAVLAGVVALLVPWPNEQRSMLALVGVGLTAALQGAWSIVRYLQGRRPAKPVDAAGSSRESDRGLLRLVHWIVGSIGHVQICSPELERRIRTRYQSEIGQLTDLGFGYLCSHCQGGKGCVWPLKAVY
jgi:hypothetical protein